MIGRIRRSSFRIRPGYCRELADLIVQSSSCDPDCQMYVRTTCTNQIVRIYSFQIPVKTAPLQDRWRSTSIFPCVLQPSFPIRTLEFNAYAVRGNPLTGLSPPGNDPTYIQFEFPSVLRGGFGLSHFTSQSANHSSYASPFVQINASGLD